VSDRLLTAEDVAQILGMRTDFIYRLAREGRIPHLRFGRTLRLQGRGDRPLA
jgi:excisionase family DNA binding protein